MNDMLSVYFWSLHKNIFHFSSIENSPLSMHNLRNWSKINYSIIMLFYNIKFSRVVLLSVINKKLENGTFILYQQSSSTNFWVSFPVSCIAGSSSRCLTWTCGEDRWVMLEGAITALGGSVKVSFNDFPISGGISYTAKKIK